MSDRELGQWILPQPEPKKKYVRIPEPVPLRTVPFGYKRSEEKGWLDPIPFELEALEKARVHVKKYTYKEVAAWLTTTTGRSITPDGLIKRFQYETRKKRRAKTYRRLARLYQEALKRAQRYESLYDEGERVDFFDSDLYKHIRDTDV